MLQSMKKGSLPLHRTIINDFFIPVLQRKIILILRDHLCIEARLLHFLHHIGKGIGFKGIAHTEMVPLPLKGSLQQADSFRQTIFMNHIAGGLKLSLSHPLSFSSHPRDTLPRCPSPPPHSPS